MMNKFKVTIHPVRPTNQDSVITIIMRFLGPDSNRKARFISENGGTVYEGLNEQAANNLATQLQKAGAESEILPIEDTEEEQQLFRIILVSSGPQSKKVVNVIRKVTGLGLRESKKQVENLGMIKKRTSRGTALETISMLMESGATIIIEPDRDPD